MKKRLLSIVLSLCLVLGMLPAGMLTASALEVELQPEGENGFYVNLPATGTDTLSLPDNGNDFTFKVYDSGGSGANYTNNCNGSLLITAPSGYILKVSGSGSCESSYDYLYIYDGSSTVPLGQESYSGSFTVEEHYTSSTSVTVKLTSDSSTTYSGFELNVTMVSVDTIATITYSYAGSTVRSVVNKGTEITLPEFSSMFSAPTGSTFLGWQCGETLYDENDPYTANGNVTFAAMVNEPPVVFGDDLTGWYANMPVNETVTADLSDRSNGFTLHVYDDGGADNQYSNGCRATMRIIAPSNCVLRFSGSGSTESGYDYLRLYDGDTNDVLGEQKNEGSFTIDTAMTTGNILKLYFYTDGSGVRDGFDLTVTVVDLSTLATLSFDAGDGTGTMNSIIAVPGESVTIPDPTFTPPENKLFSHYTDGENNYQPGSVITLGANKTLTAVYAAKATVTYVYRENTQTAEFGQGAQIQLPTCTSMFTLGTRETFVCWRNGETDYAEGDSFTVTGDVTFTATVETRPTIEHSQSFENYVTLDKTGTLYADLGGESAGSGYLLWVFDNGGPNGIYANNSKGNLVVTAPSNKRLYVEADINTESGYDYFLIYDGNSASAPLVIKKSGTATVTPVISSGQSVMIGFSSDSAVNNYRGFEAKVTVIDPATLVTLSFNAGDGSGAMNDITLLPGGSTVLPESTFTAPEGWRFDHYTDGVNDYAPGDRITVNENKTLTAVYVELVEITYDNGITTQTYLHPKGSRYSVLGYNNVFGSSLPYRKSFKQWRCQNNDTPYVAAHTLIIDEPTTFTAEYNDLPILITEESDGSTYVLMPENESVDIDLTDQDNGFTFTLYDPSKYYYYPKNIDGTLTFTAPEGYVFRLSDGTVSTEGNHYVTLTDSDLTTVLGSYAGYTAIPETYTTGNVLRVNFATPGTLRNTGFKVRITMINPATERTLSFDAGLGSGSMADVRFIAGEAITLPACAFTAPNGDEFRCWSDGVNEYTAGESVTFTENVTLTALFSTAVWVTYEDGAGNDWNLSFGTGAVITLAEFTDYFTLPTRHHFVCWVESTTGSECAEGAVYVVGEGATFTARVEPDPLLTSDGAGGWYVNMPKTGTVSGVAENISLNSSFKVYDDGGVEGEYSNSCNGYLIVTGPENTVFSVSGRGSTERSYDYLRIYGGDTTRQLINCTSNFEIEDIITSGNCLKLYFYSDGSSTASGFDLTVKVVERATVTYEYGDATETVAVQKNSAIHLEYFEDLFESETEEFLYWQNGDDTYDEGDEFLVTGNMTFTAVTRLMPTVTLDGNGAEVIGHAGMTSYGPVSLPTGTTEPMPHANMIFTAPENKCFGGWSYNGRIYNVGDEFTLTENVTFTAVWRDPNAWDLLGETLNAPSGTDLGTITLTEDIAATIGSLPLTVPAGVTVTIDLNGHTLDGNYAAVNGDILTVNGSLTFVGTGTLTGGSIMVLSSATFDAPMLSYGAALRMVYTYEDEDTGTRYPNQLYATVYYPTLYQAFMAAASLPQNFEDDITDLPENYSFWYEDYRVVMLADATISSGETWEVDSYDSIWFDLNGHTFDVQGTFIGGYSGTRVENGQEISVFYPSNIQIVSTTPGTFRSSGTIGVNIQPWTADTYYITDGTVSGEFFADGGTYYISGGHFTGLVFFNNGNDEAELEITLSGDAEFDRLEHMVYSDEDASLIHMTIGDNVRVGAMLFDIMGDGMVTYPVLTVNGGYFGFDPHIWLEEANGNTNVVQLIAEPEQYGSQTDWAADSATYTWRVKAAAPMLGDANLDGVIDVCDATAVQRHGAGIELLTGDALALADVNGDNSVDITDVTLIQMYAAGLPVQFPIGSAA